MGNDWFGSSPAIPTAPSKPRGFKDSVWFGAGRLSPPQERRLCTAAGGPLHTCTPRPCIWITWARRVWIPLRMVCWCSASTIPRLRTSLQNKPRVSREEQALTVKRPDADCSRARARRLRAVGLLRSGRSKRSPTCPSQSNTDHDWEGGVRGACSTPGARRLPTLRPAQGVGSKLHSICLCPLEGTGNAALASNDRVKPQLQNPATEMQNAGSPPCSYRRVLEGLSFCLAAPDCNRKAGFARAAPGDTRL